MIKRSAVALGLIGLTSTFAAPKMTLDQVIDKALKFHPRVKSAESTLESAVQGVKSAKAEFLPSVDARFAIGPEEAENSSTKNDNNEHRSLTRVESSLQVRQLLYSGGRTTGRINQAKSFFTEQKYNLASQEDTIAINAVDAYIAVLRNAELIKVAHQNVKAHREILKTTADRREQGIAREADVIQVKGRLALAEAQLQREITNRDSVVAQYLEAVGEKPGELSQIDDQSAGLPKDLTQATTFTALNHPELNLLYNSVKRAGHAITEAKAAYQPEVALELTASENENLSGVEGTNDSYQAMLVTNWNLFRGGADQAEIRSRMAQRATAQEDLIERKNILVRDLTVAWNSRKATLVELNYFKQHRDTVKNTLDAYEEQYKLGQRTLFDLLNVREELFQASARVVETEYAATLSVYDIIARMGQLKSFVEEKGKLTYEVKKEVVKPAATAATTDEPATDAAATEEAEATPADGKVATPAQQK